MKIAFINTNNVVYQYASGDPTAAGGAERYQWLLARAMADRAREVVVALPSAIKPGERVIIENVHFVGMRAAPFVKSLYHFLSAERPSWSFWYGSTHLLGPAALLDRLTGSRTLFAAQFDLDVRPREALTERQRFWPLYSLGLEWCSRIILQHRGQYQDLPTRWRRKSHVVPGPVVVPLTLRPHRDRDPYVAWVGVLRQPKRVDLLLEIARLSPGVRFVVCGGPSTHRSPAGYGERMRDLLNQLPNVDYLGHVEPERAVRVIAGAALLLSTSDGEGFPSVFVEAWANGTPVVSLTVDPDQLIVRLGLGTVSGSVGQAVADIARLVNNPHLRDDISWRAHNYASQTHSAPSVAKMIEQVLEMQTSPERQPFSGEQRV